MGFRAAMIATAVVVGTIGVVYGESGVVHQLHGSGTTNPSRLFWKVQDLLTNRAKLPVQMTYRAIGSSNGQREFEGSTNNYQPLNHFGSGDIPMTQDRYNEITSRGRTFIHVPFLVGAISFFHSIPLGTGQTFALSSCTLAKIFQRNITRWDHPEILAQNPGLNFPQPINVVVRADGSSSTSLSSQYLNEACPSVFVVGQGSGGSPTRAPLWPSGVTRVEGSGNMLSALRNTPYSIGYLDSGHGHSENLPEVALTNRRNQTLVASAADIGAAATDVTNVGIPAQATDSWANVNLVNADADNAWPIVTFSYMYIETNLTSLGLSGALVKAFATYLLSDDSQDATSGHLREFGFFPLPASLLATTRTNVNNLVIDSNVTEFTFESKATTLPQVGAGKYVLSAKREGWNSHVLEDFTKKIGAGAAADLEHNETIEALRDQVTSLMASSGSCSCDDNNHDMVESLSIAAIVLSALAIIISIAAPLMLRQPAPPASAPQQYANPAYAKAMEANGNGYMDVNSN